ncbi:tetratricopeptide repeat protein [Actibacterium sp. 188UL27-1]|uniref:tetratricopeptide repeat protein n=1 Tax=Actibacterium sp. 188UL27-1 TaxID=2786961 RepID=UPI0019570E10|nr:tetratricopeptide repeat protein [Actibacterium sp. 188UL27-1]MBM7066132.1 tetratricopeptide repeat protein [Actibacterium sp. 188UL27-1]
MNYDICDAPVSLRSVEALSDWNAMIRAFLAHGTQTPVCLGAVLEREPDFILGQAARGLFSMLMGRRELVETARAASETAQASLRSDTDQRALQWCAALDVWLKGHPSQAIILLERVLDDNPRDTLTAKVIHAIRFILGDATGMRASIERILPSHGTDHPLSGFIMGCHAFALEETGEYAAAERAGLAGLELATDDAWGLHAVAHVHDMTGRSKDGIALIERNTQAWDHCNNFRYHVWWHKALLHLDMGDTATVLSLYDQKIRHEKTDDYRDIANATSLLSRLELEGVDVGNRWAELADLSETRTDDGCLAFADLHYMLALTGDSRANAVTHLIARLYRDGADQGDLAVVARHPGVAVAQGLSAFGEGRYAHAFRNLSKAYPVLQTIGGSHAQRDVFERITIDAGIRAGELDGAEDILIQRRTRRDGIEDAFAARRFASISAARRVAERIPAQ